MEEETGKLLKGILAINGISLIVGLVVAVLFGIVWGVIAFGLSLLPAALVVKIMREKSS